MLVMTSIFEHCEYCSNRIGIVGNLEVPCPSWHFHRLWGVSLGAVVIQISSSVREATMRKGAVAISPRLSKQISRRKSTLNAFHDFTTTLLNNNDDTILT